jgi:FMN phosphatase YigB (HAD superfamily)
MTLPQPAPDSSDPVVFLLDVDDTLLDNDALKADMAAQLLALLGEARAARFWNEYEAVRHDTGVVDLPLTFERFARSVPDEATMAVVRSIVMNYPFAERLFPETLPALERLRTLGLPVIVSDGDTSYQARKIGQSGLAQLVNWQVVIYAHKEEHLDEIQQRWPACYYVMVDDKARILAATKRRLEGRVVTVHVLQGHYAGEAVASGPSPDITLARIGELRTLTLADFEPHLG